MKPVSLKGLKDSEIEQLKQMVMEAKKQCEELDTENFILKGYKCMVENGSSEEQQLRKQLEQAQARIKELENKQVYPAAIKRDSNGEVITSEIIIGLFNNGMNPNQISKQLGMTHQATRKRLKKSGLYGKSK